MTAFEEGQAEAPAAGVIIVDPFCDYLGIKCEKRLTDAGYAVVKASKPTSECVRRSHARANSV